MRKLTATLIGAMVMLSFAGASFAADTDSRDAREREMLRRAQEALRQSQSDNGELARAKLDAEQKLQAAAAELQSARNSSKAGAASLHTQLQASAAAQVELTRKLDDVNRQLAALTTEHRDTAGQLASRNSELKQVRLDLEQSKASGASCEAKNLQLYTYSQELLNRYQKKGVWAALNQKEPLTGLNEVSMENVVQEYREKLKSQKLTPSTPSAPPAHP
jgi:chromosome segregation ATPase